MIRYIIFVILAIVFIWGITPTMPPDVKHGYHERMKATSFPQVKPYDGAAIDTWYEWNQNLPFLWKLKGIANLCVFIAFCGYAIQLGRKRYGDEKLLNIVLFVVLLWCAVKYCMIPLP